MANQFDPRMPASPDEMARRRLFVVKQRVRGHDYETVAELVLQEFGYKVSTQMLADDFRVAMKQRATELHEETDAIRATSIARLDKAIAGIMERAEGGSLDHIEMLVKLEQRRARLLGLDAAIKTEVDDKSLGARLSPHEILERITKIQERLQERARLTEAPQIIDVVTEPREDDPIIIARQPTSAGTDVEGASLVTINAGVSAQNAADGVVDTNVAENKKMYNK